MRVHAERFCLASKEATRTDFKIILVTFLIIYDLSLRHIFRFASFRSTSLVESVYANTF